MALFSFWLKLEAVIPTRAANLAWLMPLYAAKETKKVRADIYFTDVGLFTLPTEKELQAAMEDIRQNPQQFKFSA